MPLIKIHVSCQLNNEKKQELLTSATKIISAVTGKPETYVMSMIEPADIALAGKSGPAAFVDIRGIGGLGPDINQKLSARICDLLNKSLGIPGNRVYLNFTDVPASNWGWDSQTFG